MERMTIKELANVAGVSHYTVRRTANNLYPELVKKGKKAFYDKPQSMSIIESVKKKNMISAEPLQTANVDYEAIGKMIGMAVAAALSPLVDRLDKLSNQKALPEPIKQDYYSLTAYCRLKDFKLNFSDAINHGKQLSKLCKYKSLELRKIEDERYGFVNSYPVKILNEHFSM